MADEIRVVALFTSCRWEPQDVGRRNWVANPLPLAASKPDWVGHHFLLDLLVAVMGSA
jgi:hypothetical protein